VNKESRIMLASNKTDKSDNRGEVLKPGARGLLEAIERTTKLTYMTIRDKVTKRRVHVDFLTTHHEEKHSSCQVVR
jgi:hypothetical protein